MKIKYPLHIILTVAGLVLLSAGIASACGWFGGFGNLDPDKVAERQQLMFENQVQVLNISAEEVKNYWAEGKTLKEIMEEKGITQEQIQARMKDLQIQQMKTNLQVLVDKGVITQAQADLRLQFMQDKFQNGKMGRGFFMMGFGRGFGRGFGW